MLLHIRKQCKHVVYENVHKVTGEPFAVWSDVYHLRIFKAIDKENTAHTLDNTFH